MVTQPGIVMNKKVALWSPDTALIQISYIWQVCPATTEQVRCDPGEGALRPDEDWRGGRQVKLLLCAGAQEACAVCAYELLHDDMRALSRLDGDPNVTFGGGLLLVQNADKVGIGRVIEMRISVWKVVQLEHAEVDHDVVGAKRLLSGPSR